MPRKPRFKPKNTLTKNAKKEVNTIVKKALRVVQELKYYAESQSTTTFYAGTAGTRIIQLFEPPQGLLDSNRTGDVVNIASGRFRILMVNGSGAAANPYTLARVIIFQLKRSSTTGPPLVSEIFLTALANGGAGDYGTFSARNVDYMSEYTFLYDKRVLLWQGTQNAANYGQTPGYAKYLDFSIPLKKAQKKIQFQGGSAIASNNMIYMLVTSAQLTVAAADPIFLYAAEWRFTDS